MTYLELEKDLIANNINVTSKQVDSMKTYLKMLLEWNQNINLTAIRNEEDAIEKHLFDSLLPSLLLDFNSKNIIDIGSGAGFPGIPLAILFPNSQFTLLEPVQKKAKFLSAVTSTLGLKNITVLVKRAEDCLEERGRYDIAISRAVARLNILLELSIPLIKVDGFFISMKSLKANEEIKESKSAIKKLNIEIVKISQYNLPLSNEYRENILFKKLNSTPIKYPRRFDQILKRPL
jgi:16S rRNA (guanine527-N7)-methyltransferase